LKGDRVVVVVAADAGRRVAFGIEILEF